MTFSLFIAYLLCHNLFFDNSKKSTNFFSRIEQLIWEVFETNKEKKVLQAQTKKWDGQTCLTGTVTTYYVNPQSQFNDASYKSNKITIVNVNTINEKRIERWQVKKIRRLWPFFSVSCDVMHHSEVVLPCHRLSLRGCSHSKKNHWFWSRVKPDHFSWQNKNRTPCRIFQVSWSGK